MNEYGRIAGEFELIDDREMPFRENTKSGTKVIIDFAVR
jgi:hypothetical protein